LIKYPRMMGSKERYSLRKHLASGFAHGDVLGTLNASRMAEFSKALRGVEPRSLVELRYRLAESFLDHLRTMRGDRLRPNRSERRSEIERMAGAARTIRNVLERDLPLFQGEHNEALFFGAKGPLWSPFSDRYETLIESVRELEAIARAILSVPPVGRGSTTSPFVPGYPSDRLQNPGTWARVAFARRIGMIYRDLTEKAPAVGRASDGPYQRMVRTAAAAFRQVYKLEGDPFGPFAEPSRGDMETACRSLVRKSD
jgi:hypothetical protein